MIVAVCCVSYILTYGQVQQTVLLRRIPRRGESGAAFPGFIDWVGKCIDAYGTDDVFRGGLEQYKQAMIGFLNDYRLALDLKAISARHPEEAFVFWNTRNEADTSRDKIIKDQFMHVKWHAVHEFYSKLKIGMEKSFGVAVSDISNDEITAVTHRDSKIRTALGFANNGKTYYVCNDGKGFSAKNH